MNIGSGNTLLSKDIINCDYFNYDNVDILLDAKKLPFRSNSVQLIVNIAVLEHLPNPRIVIDEILRVLDNEGEIFSVIPFIQPFHASPNDYQRYTVSGIKHLHSEFHEIDCGVGSGPVSGFLWVLQDFLSILLSFGSKKLQSLLYIILMVLTFPFKYLDIIFEKLKTAELLASSFYFRGMKKNENESKN